MAETSPICFSKFSSRSLLPRSSISSISLSRYSIIRPRNARFSRSSLNASTSSSNSPEEDPFGSFFKFDGQNVIEWVQEERVTLFTTDGLVQIGGSVVPRIIDSSHNRSGKSNQSRRPNRYQESDYMNPNQGLCIGALFDIAATNGLDLGRKLCILGFCRSVEMLSDVVEDIVVENGGEVVVTETAIKGGVHEKLIMTVAVPHLWGVPPASESLRLAVRSGGGIVEKVYWQWNFM